MVLKQVDIKRENYHCFKDLVNLKYLDPTLFTFDKKESANFDISCVKYNNRHPFRLYIKELDRYFSEEKHDGWSNKYMHIVKNDASEDYVKI